MVRTRGSGEAAGDDPGVLHRLPQDEELEEKEVRGQRRHGLELIDEPDGDVGTHEAHHVHRAQPQAWQGVLLLRRGRLVLEQAPVTHAPLPEVDLLQVGAEADLSLLWLRSLAAGRGRG